MYIYHKSIQIESGTMNNCGVLAIRRNVLSCSCRTLITYVLFVLVSIACLRSPVSAMSVLNMTEAPLSATCEVIFTAKTMQEQFEGTCWPVKFPCDSLLTMAYPPNCRYFLQCSDTRIFRCPCSPGTAYNTSKNTCVHQFDSNCACPPDSPYQQMGPTTAVYTTTTEAAPRDLTGLIAALLCALIVVIILLCVFVICLRRRRQKKRELSMKSTGSSTYASIDDKKMADPTYKLPIEPYLTPEGKHNTLPPIPGSVKEAGEDADDGVAYDNFAGVNSSINPAYDNKAKEPPRNEVTKEEDPTYLDIKGNTLPNNVTASTMSEAAATGD